MAQIDSKREIFLAKELTKKHAQTFKSSVGGILKLISDSKDSALLKGEWVMVLDGAPLNANESVLTQEMLLSLEIPPKIKAKILAKLKGGSVSEYYDILCKKQ